MIYTKKNPLEFSVSRGLVFVFSMDFFGPQVQAPIPGVWLPLIASSKRETACQLHDAGMVFLYESCDKCFIELLFP